MNHIIKKEPNRCTCAKCQREPFLCVGREGFKFFCPWCDLLDGDLNHLKGFQDNKKDAAVVWLLKQISFTFSIGELKMLNTTIKPGEYCLGILGVENKTSKTGNPYTRVDFTTLKKPEDTNPRPHFPERFSVFYTHSSQFSMSDLKKICFICGVDGVENLQGKKLRGTIGFNGDFIRLKGLKPFEKIEIQPVDCPF